MKLPQLRFAPFTEAMLALVAVAVALAGVYTHWALPVLAVAAFLFTLLLLNRPVMGLFLIAAVLPLERIGSVDVAGVTIRVHQVLSLATLAGWGLHSLLRRDWKLNLSPAYIPLLLFFASASLGLINAPNLQRAGMLTLFTLFTVVAGMTLPSLIQTNRQLKTFLVFLFTGAILTSLFGLFQYVGDIAGLPPAITGLRDLYTKEVLGFPRIHSTALEPLYFANYLFIPLFTALAMMLSKQRVFPRWAMFLISALFGVDIFLTVSRGAYIGAAVGLLFLVIVYLRRLFNPVTGVALVAIGAFAVFVGSRLMELERVYDKFLGHTLNILSGASYFERIGTFGVALKEWYLHPWIGYGLGSFGPLASFHPLIAPDGGWLIVNNEYIELLVETGVIGLTCFLVFLVVVLVQALIRVRKLTDPFQQAVVYGLTASLLATLVQYNTFSVLYIMHIWLTIGLLHRLTTKPQIRP